MPKTTFTVQLDLDEIKTMKRLLVKEQEALDFYIKLLEVNQEKSIATANARTILRNILYTLEEASKREGMEIR
jgi:hypothetical protein